MAYNLSNSNSALKDDSFFSTQPISPDPLYNYPSTKSFKVSKSHHNTPQVSQEQLLLNTNASSKAEVKRIVTQTSMKQNENEKVSTRHRDSAQTQYSDDESYYSDSFISESPPDQARRKRELTGQNKTTILNYGLLESEALWMHLSQQHQEAEIVTTENAKLPKIWSRFWNPPKQWQKPFNMNFTGKKPGTKKPKRPKESNSMLASGVSKESETSRRVLSAHRIKIKDLRNRLEAMRTEMKDVFDENKVLKRLQKKQEKALVEYNQQESELPILLQRHNNEVASLREHLRKMRDKYEKSERTLRSMQEQIHSQQHKLVKYKALAEESELPERDELYQKVVFAENECQVKQRKIEDLERYIENLNKTHKYQLTIEVTKQRDQQKQLESIQTNFTTLQLAHKEKEKELEIRNIYSNRIARVPHKLPTSYGSSPILNSSAMEVVEKHNLSTTEITPRARAQEYANKLRTEEFRRRERMKQKNKTTKEKELEDFPLPPFPGSLRRNSTEHNVLADLENDRLVRVESKKLEEEQRRMEIKRQEQEKLARLRLEEEREQRRFEREERMRQESEWEVKMNDVKRHREEKERSEREALEEQRRQASEWEMKMNDLKHQREEKDRLERDTADRKHREEEKRRFEEERKRMAQERMEEEQLERDRLAAERELRNEQRRIDNDPHMNEARKQKDLLLAKMKMIDDNQMEDIGNASGDGSVMSLSPANKKNYKFTSITENLHHGRPSHDYATGPYPAEKHVDSNGFYDDEEGYMPSFDTNMPKNKPRSEKKEKKSKLMEELFGSSQSKADTSDQNGYVPSVGPVSKKNRLLDSNSNSKPNTQLPNSIGGREKSSLVAGGNIILDDDDESLLPYRTKKKNTFTSPVISTANTFDDESIDEFIL